MCSKPTADSCFAWIENSRPRPGLTETAVTGTNLVGCISSDGRNWAFEDAYGNREFGDGDPLQELQARIMTIGEVHETAGAIGYIAYEMGLQNLGLIGRKRSHSAEWHVPEMQFLIYEKVSHPTAWRLDLRNTVPRQYSRTELDELIKERTIGRSISRDRYVSDVARIRAKIAAGQVYQANYTQSFDLPTACSAYVNYLTLRLRFSAPYMGLLQFGPTVLRTPQGSRDYPSVALLSASPERFWRKRGSRIDSRPIKGTIARGRSSEDDRKQRQALLRSAKDRAELLMITDLMRNDLGKVAKPGTVATEALVRAHATPSVWHLESIVSADLESGLTWVDVMHATFPPGSVTGTPKRRAVEILQELEPLPRGPYCGAIGWIDARGNTDFAVGIRTCVQIGDRIRIYGGGGIVADSIPEDEYYESLVKIAPLIEALTDGSALVTQAELSDSATCAK